MTPYIVKFARDPKNGRSFWGVFHRNRYTGEVGRRPFIICSRLDVALNKLKKKLEWAALPSHRKRAIMEGRRRSLH